MAIRGAGGTSGGVGEFFLGLALAALGMFLFLNRVSVTTNLSALWRGHLGLILLPLGMGCALLFFSGKSWLGWMLTLGSLGAVFVAVIANLTFFFLPTNLFRTLGMLALLFVGFGMMLRSLREVRG